MRIFPINQFQEKRQLHSSAQNIIMPKDSKFNKNSLSTPSFGSKFWGEGQIITRNEAIQKLSAIYKKLEKKPLYTIESALSAFKNGFGYSAELIDSLAFLDKVNNKVRTNVLNSIIETNSKYVKNFIDGLNSLIDNEVNSYKLATLADASINYDGEYDSNIINTAISLKKDYPKEFADFIHIALDGTGKLHMPALDAITFLQDKFKHEDKNDDIESIINTYFSLWRTNHSEEGIKTIKELAQLDLAPEVFKHIYAQAGKYYGSTFPKTDFKITDNLPPNITSKERIGAYIINRIRCSHSENNRFLKNHYEFYTEITRDLDDTCQNLKTYQDFTIKALNPKLKNTNALNLALTTAKKVNYEAGVELLDFCLENPGRVSCVTKLVNNNILRAGFVANVIASKSGSDRLFDVFIELKNNKNNIYSETQLAEILSDSIIKEKISPKVLDFIKENLSNPNLPEIIQTCLNKEKSCIDTEKLKIRNGLEERGYNLKDRKEIMALNCFDKDFLENIDLLKGLSSEYIYNIMYDSKNYNIPISTYAHIRNKSKEVVFNAPVVIYSPVILDKLLFKNPRKTINTYEFLGDKTFFYSFKEGAHMIEECTNLFGYNFLGKYTEPILELINPQNSSKYKYLEADIIRKKQQFKNVNEDEKQDLINSINTQTKRKNDMLECALKDPKEILEDAFMFVHLAKKNYEEFPKYLKLFNPKTYKDNRIDIWNKLYLRLLDVPVYDKEVLKLLDFSGNKYLPTLFQASEGLKKNFKDLINLLTLTKGKSVKEKLLNLDWNIKSKEEFEKLGIDFEKWNSSIPEINRTVSLKVERNKCLENLHLNILNNFNNYNFLLIPQKEREFIFEEISKAGFTVSKDSNQGTSDVKIGMLKGENLFFTFGLSEYKLLLNTIKKVLTEREFWSKKHSDKNLNRAIEGFKEQILNLRMRELKDAKQKIQNLPNQVVIQKADMNNLSHALFLGNHSACCTSTNGCNGWSAPLYIQTKAIQAIEIRTENDFVGNSMCFLARVNGKLSLILDNFEFKSNYQYNDTMRDEIIKFVKDFCKSIGKPNLPVYAGTINQKLTFEGENIPNCELVFIGSSGEEDLYIDCLQSDTSIQPSAQTCTLTKID